MSKNISDNRTNLNTKIEYLVENHGDINISKITNETNRHKFMVSIKNNDNIEDVLITKIIKLGINKLYKKLK